MTTFQLQLLAGMVPGIPASTDGLVRWASRDRPVSPKVVAYALVCLRAAGAVTSQGDWHTITDVGCAALARAREGALL